MKEEKKFDLCLGCNMMKNLTLYEKQNVWLCGFCKKEAIEDEGIIIEGSHK